MSRDASADAVRWARRMAALGILVGWTVKLPLIEDWLQAGWAHPLALAGHPAWASGGVTAALAWALGAVAFGVAVVAGGRWLGLGATGIGAACAAVLTVHLDTYNDATYVTALWASLWLAWLWTVDAEEGQRWGTRLAQAVVSLAFLGAVLGKLTAAYTDGTVLLNVYGLQKPQVVYRWLRASTLAVYLPVGFKVFSWAVIAGEAAIAASVAAPRRWLRWTLAFAAVVMVGTVAISEVWLLSVMAPLLGVAAAGARLSRPTLS